MVLWLAPLSRHPPKPARGRPFPLCACETFVIGPNLRIARSRFLCFIIVTQQQHHGTFGRLENNDPMLSLAKARCHLGENHFCSSMKLQQTPASNRTKTAGRSDRLVVPVRVILGPPSPFVLSWYGTVADCQRPTSYMLTDQPYRVWPCDGWRPIFLLDQQRIR